MNLLKKTNNSSLSSFILFIAIIACIDAYAQTYLISENFNGTTQPTNWHQDNFGSGTQLWTFGSNVMPYGATNFPTNAAIFDDNSAGNTGNHDLVWLWHDAIDISNCGYFIISFLFAIDPVTNDQLMWGIWDNTNYNWIPINTYLYETNGVLYPNYHFSDVNKWLNQDHPGVDPAQLFIGFGFDDIDSDQTWGVGIDDVDVLVHYYPDNNDVINATNIHCGDSITGNILGATLTETVEDCDETPENPSTERGVWFTFIGDGTEITLSTCNTETQFDTALNIYTGTPGNLICEIGSDNNSSCNYNKSKIENYPTNTGTTYYLKLSNNDGMAPYGGYKLTMTCENIGISEATIFDFKMFPNPVEKTLHLEANALISQLKKYTIS